MFPFGDCYELVQEDPVLLTPEDRSQKPYVAIVKVCDQTPNVGDFTVQFDFMNVLGSFVGFHKLVH